MTGKISNTNALALAHRLSDKLKAPVRSVPLNPPIYSGEPNESLVTLVYALLSIYGDCKGVIQSRAAISLCNYSDRGLNWEPFVNLNSGTSGLIELLSAAIPSSEQAIKEAKRGFLESVEIILQSKLVGKQTSGKLAFIQAVTGKSFRQWCVVEGANSRDPIPGLSDVIQRFLNLLASRFELTLTSARYELTRQCIDRLQLAYCQSRFLDLLGTFGDSHEAKHEFVRTYEDEIVELLANGLVAPTIYIRKALEEARYVRGSGIEVSFAGRDLSFLVLGDYFGDCTAREPRNDRDESENIHWTVYPWFLDPLYRVLIVHVDGEPAVKCHITPVELRERVGLCIDAIEAVPKLRDTIRGSANPFVSERFWSVREAILNRLLNVVCEISQRVGADFVMVDKFSNATWIVEELSQWPSLFYHVDDLNQISGLHAVKSLCREVFDLPVDMIRYELQAKNLWLFDQQLRNGFKEAAIVAGIPPILAVRKPVRGP